MFLTENSLYSNATEHANLITDKQRVANLFYLNFLGFLGLLKTDDKAGAMVSYIAQEKKLRPNTITDDNNDMSLVVKLALDAGIIIMPAAVQATKLLVLIKTKKVKGADINDDLVRDIIRACKIQSHKPSQRLYSAIQDFVDGKDDLKTLASHIYKLSKLPDFMEISKEFRDLVTRGGYISDLLKVTVPAHTAALSAAAVTPPTNLAVSPALSRVRTHSSMMPKDGAQTGDDAHYIAAISHMFKMRSVGQGYLTRFGFITGFDGKRFKQIVERPDFVLAANPYYTWDKHPFALWIKRKDVIAYNAFVNAMKSKTIGVSAQPVAAPVAHSAIQSSAKASAPKPKVIIATTPIITRESVQNMVDQTTMAGLKASFKKYAITDQALKDEAQAIISMYAQSMLFAPYYMTLNQGKFYASNHFTKYMKSQVGAFADHFKFADPHLNLLRGSILKMAQDKDFTAVFKSWDLLSSSVSRRYNSTWDAMGMTPACTALGIDTVDNYITMLETYGTKVPRAFSTYGPMQTAGFMLSDFDRMLFSTLRNSSGFGTYWIGTKLVKMLGLQHASVKGESFVVTPEGWSKLTPNQQRILNALKEKKMLNFEVREISSEDVLEARVIAAIKSGIRTTSDDEVIDEYMSKTPVEKSKIEPGTREWSYLYGTGSNERWVFNWALHNFEKIHIISYSLPDNYIRFVNWLFTSGKWKEQNIATLKKVFGGLRYPTKGEIETVFNAISNENTPIGREAFTLLGYTVDVTLIVDLFGGKYNPMLMLLNDKYRILSALAQIDPAEGVKFLNAVRADGLHDLTPSRPSAPMHYDWSILYSAWHFLPTDPQWSEALNVIQTMPIPDNLHRMATNQNVFKFLRLYNPQMFSAWEQRIKEDSKKSLKGSFIYLMQNENDESKENFKAMLRKMPTLTSHQWNYDEIYTSIISNHSKYDKETIKVMLKAYVRSMESLKVGSVDKGRIDTINDSFVTALLELHETEPRFADSIFEDVRMTTRNMLIKRQGAQNYLESIKDELYKYPIKPDMQLDSHRIQQILKYNNVDMAIPKTKKDIKKISDISKAIEKGVAKFGNLNIEEVQTTKEQNEKMSVDIYRLANDNHGDFGMKVLRTFNVEFPGSKERIEAFKKSKPNTEVMPRVFHGTGTVAASMILRNGFVVIPSKDSSTVGRALGNGIYFSNVSNKAAQYVSDAGYGRRYGTKGYLFEMEAALGDRGTDYRSAGFPGSTDSRRNFLSPEWAVFKPDDQLRIYRVHYIELVNDSEIKEMAARHPNGLNERKNYMNFEDYLKEAAELREATGTTISSYLFMDGMIPQTIDSIVAADDYKASPNVTVEECADGIIVSVRHSEDIEAVACRVPFANKWAIERFEDFNRFCHLTQ